VSAIMMHGFPQAHPALGIQNPISTQPTPAIESEHVRMAAGTVQRS
jgi:hypothetical protein